MDRHSAVNRGAKSVLLLDPPSLAKKLPDDVELFDVTLKEVKTKFIVGPFGLFQVFPYCRWLEVKQAKDNWQVVLNF